MSSREPARSSRPGSPDDYVGMARIITGAVLIIWGLAILASALTRDADGAGAYANGQKLSWVFAVVMVALGARAVIKGREARSA